MTNDMLNVKQVRLGNWRLRSHNDNAHGAEFKSILPFPASSYEHKVLSSPQLANRSLLKTFSCSSQ